MLQALWKQSYRQRRKPDFAGFEFEKSAGMPALFLAFIWFYQLEAALTPPPLPRAGEGVGMLALAVDRAPLPLTGEGLG